MRLVRTVSLVGLALTASCAVGPNYHRPSAPVQTRFKEAEGWKPAEPREAASGTPWWSVFDDPQLDELEKQIDVSNQTLKVSEAAWRQAVAVADQARAGLFPLIGVSASGTRAGGGVGTNFLQSSAGTGNTGTGTGTGTTTVITPAGNSHVYNTFTASGTASWDLDIWGKIRRTLESDVANAQATQAELAAARLSAQATLATDYVELRVTDEMKNLFNQTVEAYKRSLQITQNQYKVGIVAKADVITAETQLEGTQAQQIGLDVTRNQLEHAIAVLVGKAPADFSIEPAKLGDAIPVAPLGVATNLLERRPDIAEAERKMAAANALIGVAIAAYFPDLTLTGDYGFTSSKVAGLFHTANNLWSFGGTLSDSVLDFGARAAQVRQARESYNGSVASYRQTVLAAFQQVEDELSALRIYEQQYAVQDQTVKSANEAVRLTLNEYKAGTVAYTAVVTAQAVALSDAQTLLTTRENRLVASIALIQALGGGWNAASVDSPLAPENRLGKLSQTSTATVPGAAPTTP